MKTEEDVRVKEFFFLLSVRKCSNYSVQQWNIINLYNFLTYIHTILFYVQQNKRIKLKYNIYLMSTSYLYYLYEFIIKKCVNKTVCGGSKQQSSCLRWCYCNKFYYFFGAFYQELLMFSLFLTACQFVYLSD